MPKKITYTEDRLRSAVADSNTFADVLRTLGLQPSSGSHVLLKKRVERLGIDTSHFHSRKVFSRAKIQLTPERILVLGGRLDHKRTGACLRKALIAVGRPYLCAECGLIPFWNGKDLVLQVHHKNGLNWDNQPENLDFLCPNCHTQTDNYCSLNIKAYGTQKPKRLQRKQCATCDRMITVKASRCYTCSNKRPRRYHHKIDWPSAEELEAMIQSAPILPIAKTLGVSDNAVRKRAKKLGIALVYTRKRAVVVESEDTAISKIAA